MTTEIRTIPKIDGHIGYDDIGYILTFPFEFVPNTTREARDVRAQIIPRYSIVARMQTRYRIEASIYPRH